MNQNGTSTVEEEERDFGVYRVKVYRLNSQGCWDDKGTGWISLQHLEQSAATGLVVVAEGIPSKTLLIHKLAKDLTYLRQGGQNDDTIITWTEPETHDEVAVSFQEADGCKHIWDQIQLDQERWRVMNGGRGAKRQLVDEMDATPSSAPEELRDRMSPVPPVDLPFPEHGNLPQICKILQELQFSQKEQAAMKVLSNGWLKKFLDIFRAFEDIEDVDSLHCIYEIMKCIIMLNDTQLLETLFSEEIVMDVVGALEYDPELKEQQRHRQYLRERVVFKEVVPITLPGMKSKIHETYRIGYVKDVILPRVLDDATFASLSSIVVFNNIEVLTALAKDSQAFRDFFQKFQGMQPMTEAWCDSISFLQELTLLAKTLQYENRSLLIDTLVALGLFDAITVVLEHGDGMMQSKATDILLATVQHDASLLRSFLLGNKDEAKVALEDVPDCKLFNLLIAFVTSGRAAGLQEQVVEIVRSMLDPTTMTHDAGKSVFLDKFYSVYVGPLVQVIEAGANKAQKPEEGPSAQAINLILDIFCFCVKSHTYRIKYYVLHKGIMDKVMKLLHRRERWLVVAAIRFVRFCVGAQDEFYNRFIVKHKILEPIITVFLANGERNNLLNSVVLEMFNFIRLNNMKALIDYFVETQYQRVEDVDYDVTFVRLKTRYEQNHDRSTETGIATDQLQEQRIRRDARALDRDEESYFNEEDDDEESAYQPALAADRPANGNNFRPRPLVEYEDEDHSFTNLPVKRASESRLDQMQEKQKQLRFLEDPMSPQNVRVQRPQSPHGSMDWRRN